MKRFAVLLILLLLAGCGQAPETDNTAVSTQPDSPASIDKPADLTKLQYEERDLLEAEKVAHVTFRLGQRLPSHTQPLWGDREEDRPKIAHILRLIRLARPAESPEGSREGMDEKNEMLITVAYADGRLVQVGDAYRRLATEELEPIPGRMYIPGTGEVSAPELAQFERGAAAVSRANLMPPIDVLDVQPLEAQPGSIVTVSGAGWVGVERASLVLRYSGTDQKWALGEVALERGSFTWQGSLPQDVKPARWWYRIYLEAAGEQLYATTVHIVAP